MVMKSLKKIELNRFTNKTNFHIKDSEDDIVKILVLSDKLRIYFF